MTLRDEFGCVSRGEEMRLLYGDRRGHGRVTTPPPVPVGIEAAKVNPFERKPAVAPEPPRVRGRNKKYGNPDHGLAERIRAAGAACNDGISNARERQMTMQSTIYLIYARARVGMEMVADMYGYADHTGARPSIRAVRDRMARDITAADEEERQARIMRVAARAAPPTNPQGQV